MGGGEGGGRQKSVHFLNYVLQCVFIPVRFWLANFRSDIKMILSQLGGSFLAIHSILRPCRRETALDTWVVLSNTLKDTVD